MSSPNEPWRSLIERWVREERIDQVVELPSREAVWADLPEALHPRTREHLGTLGFARLYRHQREAFDRATAREDFVVVTGTNSGKSLCFHLPILDDLLREPMSRALVLYPTKALAHDQLSKIHALTAPLGISLATLDGDTPMRQRTAVKNLARIVLSNPDFVHHTLLPKHDLWVPFLRSLRFVVLDEAHVYRGVFGSHVANVMRRLLRLCQWHGNRPLVIAASATIGNPVEHLRTLTGREVALVDRDGSPQGGRTFALGGRMGSPNHATARMLVECATAGVRTLAFCRSRNGAELVLRYARDLAPDLADRLEAYRSGYTPKERRDIEQGLAKGRLLGLAATNALELGIDVGGLDAVIVNGYPGSIAGLFQQAGRAGRGVKPGLAVFLAHDDPMEQFLVRDAQALISSRSESAVCNPDNPQVLGGHLRCAAYERPLNEVELRAWSPSALPISHELAETNELRWSSGMAFYPSHSPPAPTVSIRGLGGRPMTLVANGAELGTMEAWRAAQWAHVGAIYLHRGEPFIVVAYDEALGRVHLEPSRADYTTSPVIQTTLSPTTQIGEVDRPQGQVSLLGLEVTEQVTGFRRKAIRGGDTLGIEDLDLPPIRFNTVGVRLTLHLRAEPDNERFLGAVHGLEHAVTSVAPLVAGCDRSDLGSAWFALFPNPLHPSVFVFDKTQGGMGLAAALYERRDEWLTMALELLTGCPCLDGCPRCLFLALCPDSNRLLDKDAAVAVLRMLVA